MKRRQVTLVLGLLGLLPAPARAQDSEQFSSDFIKVYTVVSYVATVKGYCDSAVPASKAVNTAALDAWKKANTISQIEALTVQATQKIPAIKDSFTAIRAKMLSRVKQSAAGREAALCGQLPDLLKEPSTQVGTLYKTQIAQLAQVFSVKPAPSTAAAGTTSSTAAGTLKLEPGHYDCVQYKTYNKVDKGMGDDTAEPWGTFDLFANGEYSSETKASIELPSSPLDWPKTMGRYATYFNGGVQLHQIDWKTGGYTEYTGRTDPKGYDWKYSRDRPTYYKIGKDGRLVVLLQIEDYGFHVKSTECHRQGPTVRKTPTQMMQAAETAETYLQPARVKAAPPPPGSGGLQGVYLGERPLYLSKSGYYSQDWRWGFDRLDCTRALIPGAPLKKCKTYQKKGNTLVMDGEARSFQKRPGGELVIGDQVYVPVAPMHNLRLEGSYTYSYSSLGSGFAGGGSQTLRLTKGGTFSLSSGSFLSISTPDTDLASVSDGQNPNAGKYALNGYSITLTFNTGLKVNYSFIPDPGSQAFYLLGQRYSLDK
jgi:hypothetical protein